MHATPPKYYSQTVTIQTKHIYLQYQVPVIINTQKNINNSFYWEKHISQKCQAIIWE